MIIWTYTFQDKTKLELMYPLTGIELVKQFEKHGYVVVNFREVKDNAQSRERFHL